MMLLGIEGWVFVVSFAMFGIFFYKIRQYEIKVSKQLYQTRARLKALSATHERLKARKRQAAPQLPPAFREENWMRNVWTEPLDENVIMASTGCELTDAIYAAAQRANIDIVAFETEFKAEPH